MIEEEKKVASIERISRIYPAENADRIELAEMEDLGWQCVVKKDQFKVGDNIVFICIDSIVPRRPWTEFLFKGSDKQEHRVDKGRFRGNLSSGIILPIAELSTELHGVSIQKGMDIGPLIGVRKYVRVEKEEDDDESKPLTAFQRFLKAHKTIRGWLYKYLPFWFKPRGRTLGEHPTFLPKTDEDNLESRKYILEDFKRICAVEGCSLYISLKADGSSMGIFNYKGEEGLCSRKLQLNPHHNNNFSNLYRKLLEAARKNGRKTVVPDGYLIQGEIVGPSIQKNKMSLSEHKFRVFNIVNIETGRLLDYDRFVDMCVELGLERVEELPVPEGWYNFGVNDWCEYSAKVAKYGDNPGEGIVIRPKKGVNANIRGIHEGRASAKVINPDYFEEDPKKAKKSKKQKEE